MDETELRQKKRYAEQEVEEVSNELESLKKEFKELFERWSSATSGDQQAWYEEEIVNQHKHIEMKESLLEQKLKRVALYKGIEAVKIRRKSADNPETINKTDLAETVRSTLVEEQFTQEQAHTVLRALDLPVQPENGTRKSPKE